MKILAVLAIAVWVLASFIFMDWHRSVAYPEKPLLVKATTSLAELLYLALAVWILA